MMVEHDLDLARQERTLTNAATKWFNEDSPMDKTSRIFVAGHRGLVGSAICRRLGQEGYGDVIVRTDTSSICEDAAAVRDFFTDERPSTSFSPPPKWWNPGQQLPAGGVHP